MKKYLALILFSFSIISILYAQENYLPLEMGGYEAVPAEIAAFVDTNGNPLSSPDSMVVYSSILTASGGDPISGYIWEISPGSSFPPGITVDPFTGILKATGDKLIAGSYNFNMTVSDGLGDEAQGTYSYTVEEPVSWTAGDFWVYHTSDDTISVLSVDEGAAFTGKYFASSVGASLRASVYLPPSIGLDSLKLQLSWTIYSGSLPTGLTLDLTRGVIEGTALNSDGGQTYRFRIKVTDRTGRTGIGPPDSITVYSLPTSVQLSKQNPLSYNLEQNYPDPFNPTTTINYQIPNLSHVTLRIYDILGREVSTRVNGYKAAGKYTVTFNASHLASGVYFYQLRSDNFVSTKKLLLLK